MNVNLDLYYESNILAAYQIDAGYKPHTTPTVSIDLTEVIDLLIRDGCVQRSIFRNNVTTGDAYTPPLNRTVKQKPKPETTA